MKRLRPEQTGPRGGRAALLLGVLALAGCGGGKGDVAGHVHFNGKPLPLGMIAFHAQEGKREVFTALVRDGSYSLQGVPAGPAQVTVVSADAAKPSADGRKQQADSPADALPRRYAVPTRSGLSVEIRAGTQEYNLELKP
jgi:hypothetical protein